MGPVDYGSATTPEGYHCEHCEAAQVKLWRRYQTFLDQQTLLCAACVEAETGERLEGKGHSIGWWVGAVPTADGETFWGYTSVPEAGVAWWDRLPKHPAPAEAGP